MEKAKIDADKVDLIHVESLKHASEDCMVIKLTARLDNFRCLSFNVKRNPLVYINNTFERYLPIAESTSNKRLHWLATELRKEANKFFG